MKLSLAQNICRLRKQNGLTQERLAEALGVTFAAVSKWERGVATPDLGLMAELASLFSVSLDALAGFELQQSSAEALARRLLHLQREKRFGEAVSEAEEALRRYPNDFRVVYRCGSLYELAGLEQNRPDWASPGPGSAGALPSPAIPEYRPRRQRYFHSVPYRPVLPQAR